MGQIIVFTSGKGGVGKSTLVANIGTSIALAKKRVVVIDMDIGLRNLDMIIGLERKVKANIVDLTKNLCTLDDALVYDKRTQNYLALIAASQSDLKKDINLFKFHKVLNDLEEIFDYIIIDSPAGIEEGFNKSVFFAKKAIVVVNPEISSIRDADRVLALLENHRIKKEIFLLINRYRKDLSQRSYYISATEIIDLLHVPCIGIISEDERVLRQNNSGVPFVYQSSFSVSTEVKDVTDKIVGKTKSIKRNAPPSKSIWEKMKKNSI
ncbi:MAG: septum site-determining protein MinD [Caldisericia bacterium]|nr:septum site-determining protein MinD [Caldisericia bacterium]